ncbi:unnamed protein product, partial [Ectocarpus sp. 6 AP-2014]
GQPRPPRVHAGGQHLGVGHRVQPEHRLPGVVHLLLQVPQGRPAQPYVGAGTVLTDLPAAAAVLHAAVLPGEGERAQQPSAYPPPLFLYYPAPAPRSATMFAIGVGFSSLGNDVVKQA